MQFITAALIIMGATTAAMALTKTPRKGKFQVMYTTGEAEIKEVPGEFSYEQATILYRQLKRIGMEPTITSKENRK